MITSWSAYLTRLTVLIAGDDPGSSSLPVNTLEAATSLAESRIYREVMSRFNEKAFASVTVSGNAASLPSDFENPSIVHFGGAPLEPVSEEFLREYLDGNPSGEARYFAVAGSSLMFAPSVSDATAVQGRYFCRLPALSSDTLPTNALFAAANDLFLYAALVECAPQFEQDARIPVWDAKYRAIRDQLNRASRNAAHNAGRLRVRPSTPVLR